ncbi:serine hydrolase domain-containing protein [Altererythrobacter sp. Z27]|uniref:serine hydrolase domain-containing protein n=1 Tax=Altererythrobacter sp. Z27 TaxID=3461147 RepID=UPI004043ACED
MKLPFRPNRFVSSVLVPILTVTAAVASTAASASPVSTTMPDTEAGEIGEMVIARINADDQTSIQQWASTILAPTIDASMQDAFLKQLAVAVRDSGGVDFVDARTQGPPGMLVVTIKGRRTGQLVALVLLPDPEQPGKLAMVDMVSIDDPTLYDGWPETGASQADIARLAGAALDQLANTTDFSGCLSISDGATTFFDECRGLADRTFGVATDRETKFHIGSMNKMFTAVAIAQLAESGKLRWDASLAEVMPEYPDQAAAAKITVWQLLRHTSGLGDFFVPEFFQNREKFVNPGDYLDLIARQPIVFEPGADWSYSNAGYILLGRIVENVSGESYFDYVERHIFEPAGMTSSGFGSLEDVTEKLATGYFKDGAFATTWKANWMTLPFKGSPAGGGYSTNEDLLKFANAFQGGKLVGPATLQKMFEDGVRVGPGKYAAGFGDRPSNGRQIRGHAGGAPGMSANLAMVWETGAAVAVTSNQGDTPTAMLLSERIADMLASQGQKP